jgi:hypothetical protein
MAQDDWRLTNQEKYLGGAVFVWKRWKQSRDSWDHDHCEFCSAKFGEPQASESDCLQQGYSTLGPPDDPRPDYYWVCEPCFQDFRDRLQLKVAEP